MSENKHTPGPWHTEPVFGSDDVTVRTAQRSVIACVKADANPVAPNAEANAHVIAAAPELLAQLEALVEAIDTCHRIGIAPPRPHEITGARDAIRKARGEG